MKRKSFLIAITLRLAVLVFGVWLMGMAYVTVGTAQYVFEELAEGGYDFASVGRLDDLFSDDEYAAQRRAVPGIVENYMQYAIARGKVRISSPHLANYSGTDGDGIYRGTSERAQTAMVFLDQEGNVVQQSGDFVYFSYVTEDGWQAGEDEGPPSGYGWLDVSDKSDVPGSRYGFLHAKYNGVHDLYDYRAMRLTGYFEGSRFEPYAMAIMDDWAVHAALDQIEPDYHIVNPDGSEEIKYTYTLSGLDAQGLIEWDVRFDRTAEAPADRELVTIYALDPEMFVYEPGREVNYQGRKYENRLALLREEGYYRGSDGL